MATSPCRTAHSVAYVAPRRCRPHHNLRRARGSQQRRCTSRWRRIRPDEDGTAARLPRLPRHRQQDRWPRCCWMCTEICGSATCRRHSTADRASSLVVRGLGAAPDASTGIMCPMPKSTPLRVDRCWQSSNSGPAPYIDIRINTQGQGASGANSFKSSFWRFAKMKSINTGRRQALEPAQSRRGGGRDQRRRAAGLGFR